MKFFEFLRARPALIWGMGAVLVLFGEVMAANDERDGGTISEWFWRQPPVTKYFIVWLLGNLHTHLTGWGKNE